MGSQGGTRSGSGWRRASPPVRETPRTGGGGGRTKRSTRRSPGGSCWARRSARRPPAPAWARTTRTAGRRGARPGCPAPCCRACDAGRHGSASSSTPPGRSVTPNWAARSSRSPPSPAPWAAAATWSPWCPATRRRRSRTRCAVPRNTAGGRRGTDLRTGFAKALRARPRPDVVVVLTDGQTPWPDRPPCRTVVGLFPREPAAGSGNEDDPDYAPDAPPAWARVVVIG